MINSPTHPHVDSDKESLSSRVVRWSMVGGFLGILGFLEHLTFVSDIFEAAQLFYLFFLLFFIPPLGFVATQLWDRLRSLSRSGETGDSGVYDEDDPRHWIDMAYEPDLLKTLQAVAVFIHPTALLRGIPQIIGSAVAYLRHGGHLPAPDTYSASETYRLPFAGEWTVVNGSPDKRYSHSWIPARQRYAYDFVITDDQGRTHDGSRELSSFYCFGEPILAPADGTVVRAKDGHRDHHRTTGWMDPLVYRLAGNYVVIKHADEEYSFLAHLKKGSICVSVGDSVERGEEIGRCGHSGMSSEPHLHFHVQDHHIPYVGAGLPVQFTATCEHPDAAEPVEGTGWLHCGLRVTPTANSDSN